MDSIYSFNFIPDMNDLKMERPTIDKLHPLINHSDSKQLNLDLTLSPSLYSNSYTTNLATAPPPTPSPSPSKTLKLSLPNPMSPFFSPLAISPKSKRIKTEGSRSQNKNITKLSDKIYGLEKIMPWEKRLPILTTLQETYNYIKFLQSQLASLQSMPKHSSFQTTVMESTGASFDGMENLNRQQLLQVLINSSRVQTILCSKQLCVFSAEQLNRGSTLLNTKLNGENGSEGSCLLN